MVEFREWPKIPRGGNGELITITEKIDGTNACVIVEEFVDFDGTVLGCWVVGAQSRNQLLAHTNVNDILRVYNDNYGFAKWVVENQEELAKLGPGYHYGEWAGPGIQGNPHKLERKTLFLFNSERWRDGRQQRPAGVECVPVLYEGPYEHNIIKRIMDSLLYESSLEGDGKVAYQPEGIIVWYHKARRYEKYTYKNVEGKWKEVA